MVGSGGVDDEVADGGAAGVVDGEVLPVGHDGQALPGAR